MYYKAIKRNFIQNQRYKVIGNYLINHTIEDSINKAIKVAEDNANYPMMNLTQRNLYSI